MSVPHSRSPAPMSSIADLRREYGTGGPSAQSAVSPDRAHLERQHAELMAKYPDGNVPRPPHWGGYRVIPAVIEFWQGRPSRLHDRIAFTRRPDGSWRRERLAP